MCMSCGCNDPYDDHGNPNNIVYDDLKKAGDAESISVQQVIDNIEAAMVNVKE
jgi:hypothetical protein